MFVWIYYMYMYVCRHHIGVRSDKILCFTWGKQKDSHVILGFI